jgi:hypothetical protein
VLEAVSGLLRGDTSIDPFHSGSEADDHFKGEARQSFFTLRNQNNFARAIWAKTNFLSHLDAAGGMLDCMVEAPLACFPCS